MFRGIYKVSLDERGRIAVPVRFREMLRARSEGKVVVTIDPRDRCLLLYALEDWSAVEKELTDLANLKPQARYLQRTVVGHALDVEMDNAGRVLLSPPLREYAGLAKRVAVLGQANKLELWDEETLNGNLADWLEQGNQAMGDLEGLDGVHL